MTRPVQGTARATIGVPDRDIDWGYALDAEPAAALSAPTRGVRDVHRDVQFWT